MNTLTQVDMIAGYLRPALTVHSELEDVYCLFDTGAMIPVWTGSEALLQRKFPKAYLLPNVTTFVTGFNSYCRNCPVPVNERQSLDRRPDFIKVYIIPELLVVNDEVPIVTLYNVPIAVADKSTDKFQIILSTGLADNITLTMSRSANIMDFTETILYGDYHTTHECRNIMDYVSFLNKSKCKEVAVLTKEIDTYCQRSNITKDTLYKYMWNLSPEYLKKDVCMGNAQQLCEMWKACKSLLLDEEYPIRWT